MKREIEFRGKRIDDGEWVYGSLTISKNSATKKSTYISNNNVPAEDQWAFTYEVDPETVGQFTGLKDSNGVEIYEGDILKHEVKYNLQRKGEIFKNTVEFFMGNTCGWRIRNGSFHKGLTENWIFNQEPEVIGNIHESK